MTPLAEGAATDTIFALATGPGRAAIAIIRLSGPATPAILTALAGPLPTPRRATLRKLHTHTGTLLDHALILFHPSPASYTGEDTAELHLHGGRAILAAVTAALLHAGARPADPGEFTRRAFLGGKMDLLEAEAIADLVDSETEAQRLAALRQLGGAQSALLAGWAARLTHALAFQETLIDFPDEDLPPHIEATLLADLENLLVELQTHIALAPAGERLRTGLTFAIAGLPNAGKSSLLNALARRDAAIVSPHPGTTRDPIEIQAEFASIPVTLIDTAGLRPTADPIEAEGIARARARTQSADLVLHLIDASNPTPPEPPPGPTTLLIANKIDLAPPPPGAIGISVKSGEGLPALEALLATHAARLTHAGATPLLSRARHTAALRDAATGLSAALAAPAPELRAEDLRHAHHALARITGKTDPEALLDVIFRSFCIGK